MLNLTKVNGFINGIFLGIISIVSSSYIYFEDLSLLTSVYFGGITIIISVIIGIASILKTKSKLNGQITFKESFTVYFYTLLTGTLLGTLYLIILFKFFFGPEKIELIKQTLIDFNVYIMKLNNANENDIAKSITLSKKFDPSSAIEIITSALKYLLRDCLIGFIVALIFRNKRTFSS
jgi:hypothetical protein